VADTRDNPGRRHSIRTNQQSTFINLFIFTPDAFRATTLPIYPGLGQAQEYAGLHTPVAWICDRHNTACNQAMVKQASSYIHEQWMINAAQHERISTGPSFAGLSDLVVACLRETH